MEENKEEFARNMALLYAAWKELKVNGMLSGSDVVRNGKGVSADSSIVIHATEDYYVRLEYIILSLLSFISFLTVLLFLQANLFIVDDCMNGNSMFLHICEQFLLAFINLKLESKLESQLIFPFPLQRLRTYYKHMMQFTTCFQLQHDMSGFNSLTKTHFISNQQSSVGGIEEFEQWLKLISTEKSL